MFSAQQKRQRTADMDEDVDGPSGRAKRLRPSDMSLDEIQHVDALLSATDDDAADRDEPMEADASAPVHLDKGKQRMIDEPASLTVSNHNNGSEDDSRNVKVVNDLETELRCVPCSLLIAAFFG